jgi:hypothetical protein
VIKVEEQIQTDNLYAVDHIQNIKRNYEAVELHNDTLIRELEYCEPGKNPVSSKD